MLVRTKDPELPIMKERLRLIEQGVFFLLYYRDFVTPKEAFDWLMEFYKSNPEDYLSLLILPSQPNRVYIEVTSKIKLKYPTFIKSKFLLNLSGSTAFRPHQFRGYSFGRVTVGQYRNHFCQILDVDFEHGKAIIRMRPIFKNPENAAVEAMNVQKSKPIHLYCTFNRSCAVEGYLVDGVFYSNGFTITKVYISCLSTWSCFYNSVETEKFFKNHLCPHYEHTFIQSYLGLTPQDLQPKTHAQHESSTQKVGKPTNLQKEQKLSSDSDEEGDYPGCIKEFIDKAPKEKSKLGSMLLKFVKNVQAPEGKEPKIVAARAEKLLREADEYQAEKNIYSNISFESQRYALNEIDNNIKWRRSLLESLKY